MTVVACPYCKDFRVDSGKAPATSLSVKALFFEHIWGSVYKKVYKRGAHPEKAAAFALSEFGVVLDSDAGLEAQSKS